VFQAQKARLSAGRSRRRNVLGQNQLRFIMGKSLTVIFIGCVLSTTLWAADGSPSPGSGLFIRVDWQEPAQLPLQFRNHCTVENFTARPA
jgi:hypothetical protein